LEIRLAVTAVSLLSLTLALLVGLSGAALGGVAWFWLFSVLASLATIGILQRWFPWHGLADRLIRGAVVGTAVVVFCGLVLGGIGWLGRAPYAIVLAVLAAGAQVLKGGPSRANRITVANIPWPAVAFCGAILAVVISFGLSHSPLTAYDSLSYHLFFPARWLQEHRLSIIATPFSDEAQSYAPANGELFFLWLMAPLHSDQLARIGQVPFYVLIGIALYALARRTGARPGTALYPALFAMVSRPVVEQAVGADVDLICWSLFLASLYLGLHALETNERRDWALLGVSLGLYAGTKYVALVYVPVLALLIIARVLKRTPSGLSGQGGRAAALLWAIPGVLAFSLPWYLRNWVVAGSPLYPASLSLAGVTIARGAYSRAAMLHSVFHTTELRLFPVMAAHAFGVTLILCWLPLAAAGAWAIVRQAQRWPGVFLLVAPVLMVPLYWFGVPDNVDSRFLLPAAILALVPVAFAFRPGRSAWNAVVHGLCALSFCWICVGANAELHADLPWYMGGWLSLRGIVSLRHLPVLVATGAAGAGAWWVLRRTAYRPALMVGTVALAAVLLTRAAATWCAPEKCEYLQTTSTFLRSTFFSAWHWVDALRSPAIFAYTGNNVPYPLIGPRLTNHVYYVNIDRHLSWRFHDYDRAFRQRVSSTESAPLATSSGVLLPLKPASGPLDAVRPRYERIRGDRSAWISNLKALRVDHVFISALSAYEVDYVWHNEGGFPIEDDWARADPQAFTLVYENPQIRIYAVEARSGP
jgi:hypothetical protein